MLKTMGKTLKLGDIFSVDDQILMGDHFHYGDSTTKAENVSLPTGRYYILTKSLDHYFVSNIEPLRGEFYLLGKADVYRVKQSDLVDFPPISKVPTSERKEVVEFLKQVENTIFHI